MTTHLETDMNHTRTYCAALPMDGGDTSDRVEAVDCRDCLEELITDSSLTLERLLVHPSGTPRLRAAVADQRLAARARLMGLDHVRRAGALGLAGLLTPAREARLEVVR